METEPDPVYCTRVCSICRALRSYGDCSFVFRLFELMACSIGGVVMVMLERLLASSVMVLLAGSGGVVLFVSLSWMSDEVVRERGRAVTIGPTL